MGVPADASVAGAVVGVVGLAAWVAGGADCGTCGWVSVVEAVPKSQSIPLVCDENCLTLMAVHCMNCSAAMYAGSV